MRHTLVDKPILVRAGFSCYEFSTQHSNISLTMGKLNNCGRIRPGILAAAKGDSNLLEVPKKAP